MARGAKPSSNTYNFNKEKKKRQKQQKARQTGRTSSAVRHSSSSKNTKLARSTNNARALPAKKNQPANKVNEFRKLLQSRNVQALVGLFLIIFILVTVFALTNKNAQEIYLNQVSMGTVWGKKLDAETLQATAVGKLEADLGVKVSVNETVSVQLVHTKKNETVSIDKMLADLADRFTYKVEAAQIRVDGIELATVKTVHEANSIQDQIKSAYDPKDMNIISSEFVENVTVTTSFVEPATVMPRDRALDILTTQKETRESYIVPSGGSFWTTANRFSMSLEELLEINDLTIDFSLPAGYELEVIIYKPLLSITTVADYVVEKVEPKSIEKRENHNEPKSYTSVVQAGKDGQVEITMRRTFLDGILISEEEYSRKIVLEPLSEIIEVGTQ